jgi:hypothetical protein
LNELATIVHDSCRRANADDNADTFEIDTTPNAKQRQPVSMTD